MWSILLKKVLSIGKPRPNEELDRVEDPVHMIELAIAELEQIIATATKALTIATENQRKLELQHHQFRSESLGWYQKAAAALKAGNEEQAQKHLAQKALVDKKEVAYKSLVDTATGAAIQLQEQLDDYKIKLDEIKTKQAIYAAKAENARAQKQIAESLGGLNGSALANINTYEDEIDQLQAEAESMIEINSGNTRLEKELKKLENTMDIQSDIEKIRIDMENQAQLKEQQKLAEIKQKFEELNKSTHTRNIKALPVPPKEDLAKKQEAIPPKDPTDALDIDKKFEELNKSTNTRKIKVPPSGANPKDDLNKKMDDFFKKK